MSVLVQYLDCQLVDCQVIIIWYATQITGNRKSWCDFRLRIFDVELFFGLLKQHFCGALNNNDIDATVWLGFNRVTTWLLFDTYLVTYRIVSCQQVGGLPHTGNPNQFWAKSEFMKKYGYYIHIILFSYNVSSYINLFYDIFFFGPQMVDWLAAGLCMVGRLVISS